MLSFRSYLAAVCALLCIFSLQQAVANDNNSKVKITKDKSGKVTAFSYVIPGKYLGNGKYELDKIVKVNRQPSSKYFGRSLYIKVKPDITTKDEKVLSSSRINQILQNLDGKIKKFFTTGKDAKLLSSEENELSRIYSVNYKAEVDPFDACLELVQSGDVVYACPNTLKKVCEEDTTALPNDPMIGNQWAVTELNMKDAWKISKGSKKVRIGIVDSGVIWDHEDLFDNIWVNPNDTLDGIDNDGDGKIDDIRGWDFTSGTTAENVAKDTFKITEDNDPSNIYSRHGTMVSGLVSAVTNNGKGIAGFGYGCTLIPVKCGFEVQDYPGLARVNEAMQYMGKLKPDIINCSWGGTENDPAMEDAFNYCLSEGILVIVAAGNESYNLDDTPEYPVCYKGILSVGATAQGAKIADYSNYGYPVTVYAPGSLILTTDSLNTYNGQYSGTSFSAPITSGIAGLIKAAHPDWNAKQIYHQIRSTAKNNLVADSTLRPLYYGMIDPVAALTLNSGNNATIPGVEYENLAISSNDSTGALTDTVKHQLSFNVKNYLGDTKNLTVTLSALDDFFTIDNTNFTLGTLKKNEEKPLSTNIHLNNMMPWDTSYARILVTYRDGNYIDYEEIKIPIEIETSNEILKTTVEGNVDYKTNMKIYWTTLSSLNENNHIGLGYVNDWGALMNGQDFHMMNIGSYCMDRLVDSLIFHQDLICSNQTACSYVLSANVCFAGSVPASNYAGIYKRTNASDAWNLCSGSDTIATAFKNINFFDDNNGISIGDPKNGYWGIAVTNNQGNTWTALNMPLAINDASETTYNTACSWVGNIGWFGTSSGRIYKTNNSGQSWNTYKVPNAISVNFLAFANGLKGICLYKKDTTTGTYYVAQTLDGGQTWNDVNYSFIKHTEYNPINLFRVDGSNLIVLVFNDFRVYGTEDFGKTWAPVISQKNNIGTASTIFASTKDSKAYITAYNDAGEIQLVFNYNRVDDLKHLNFTGNDTLYFPDTQIGKNSSVNLSIQNDGNSLVICNGMDISTVQPTDAKEFSIVGGAHSLTVDGGSLQILPIQFAPKSLGDKIYKIQIKSDAVNAPNTVILKGRGVEPSGMPENITGFECTIVPNPFSDAAEININNGAEGNYRIDLYDLNGVKVMNVFSGYMNIGTHNFTVDSKNLCSGQYFLEINKGMEKMVKQVMIVK